MANRSWTKRAGYAALRVCCRIAAVVLFGIRCRGRENLPATGPVLVCANHQSFLDPVLVGLLFPRRLNYLARKTLFRFGPFRWLIEFLDAIPLDRDGLGVTGLKECLRRIKQGEMVLLFPEGTRTHDGEVAPLQPGFLMLARRGGVSLLPVGFDGAFASWPRTSRLPRPAAIDMTVGEPISSAMIATLSDEDLLAEVTRRLKACHARSRAALQNRCR